VKVRKWLRILHRDIGYLAVGLTIIFSVSGIAVNHIHEWNPNYSIENTVTRLKTITSTDNEEIVNQVLAELEISEKPEGWHRTDPLHLQIFLDGNTIDVNLDNSTVHQEKISSRPLLREFNILHLNEPKQAWTWFSDFYAVNLIFLAISGIFLLKGKKGWKWRGTWMVSIGVIIPILFLLYYQ
jgi:uncharacterized protein